MAEYIEREGIKKSISFLLDIRLNVAPEIKQLVLDTIDSERAADAQRVKRGEWGKRAYNRVQCSYCGKCEDIATDFCPNCGADMRGEGNG